jgi:hypothetical protein
MRIILFFSLFLIGCSTSKLKQNVSKYPNTSIHKIEYLSYFPYKKKLVISFSRGEQPRKWIVFFRDQSKWYRVDCTFHQARAIGSPLYTFDRHQISNSYGDSMVKLINEQRIWNIKDTDNGCEESEYKLRNKFGKIVPCVVHDGYISVITIVVKSKAMIKKYYRPEVWEDSACCPGNKDRLAFIKCFDIINGIKKK